MIQESLRILAEFKDNASAGLKKVKDGLTGLEKQSKALNPLANSQVDKKLKDITREAQTAAKVGVGGLTTAFEKLKGTVVGVLSGGQLNIGDAIVSGASSASSALTSFGAAATGAGAAVVAASKATTVSLKDTEAVLATLTKRYEQLGKIKTPFKPTDVAGGLKAFDSAKLDSKKPDDTLFNAGAREAYKYARALGFASLQAGEFRNTVTSLASAAQQTATPLGILKTLLHTIFVGNVTGAERSANTLALRAIGSAALTATAAVAALGTVVAGVAGAIGLSLNAAADDAAELADKLGITVDRLEALKLIANETGTSVEALQKTYDRLAKVLDKTDEESDKAAVSLANLGLSFEDIKKLKPEQSAALILQRYEDLGRTSEATAAAQVLLGQGFRESSIGIKQAATEFDKYADRVKEFGAGESKLLAAQGAEQEVAVNNLALSFKGLGIQIAENIGPTISRLVQSFADLVNLLRQTKVVGMIVNGVFSVLNLVFNDFGRLLGGIAATLVAFFSGEFRQSFEIAKATVADATAAVKNFGDRSKDSAAQAVAAAEATTKADEAAAEARKKAAEAEAKRLKALAAAKKAAEEQLKLFNDAKSGLEQQLGLLGKETQLEKTLWDIQSGRYRTLNDGQKAELAGLAAKIDLKNKELENAQKLKDLQGGLDEQKVEVSLAEEEVRFAALTSEEREKQVFLMRELNRLRVEGAGQSQQDQEDLHLQVKVLANKRLALKQAQADAAVISGLIDNSEAAITASVQRNIQIAAGLLEQRKISEQDYVRFVQDQVKRITDLNKEAAEEVTAFWTEAARGIQQALSTFLFDFMQGKLGDLAGSFKKVIDQMVANALAARLGEALFGKGFEKGGNLGGLAGQGLAALSGLFGGGRANGGPVEPGRAYMVGERGPELRTFSKAGSIIPTEALMGGAGSMVTVNISAVDSKSFLQQIDSVKRELTEAVITSQRRYNLRSA